MNDTTVWCQNASVTEPQRDSCHRKVTDEVFWFPRDVEGAVPYRFDKILSLLREQKSNAPTKQAPRRGLLERTVIRPHIAWTDDRSFQGKLLRRGGGFGGGEGLLAAKAPLLPQKLSSTLNNFKRDGRGDGNGDGDRVGGGVTTEGDVIFVMGEEGEVSVAERGV